MSGAEVITREETLEGIDWATPCQYPIHRGERPADWAVWYSQTRCCAAIPDFRYFCSPCWDYRNSWGLVDCVGCGARRGAMQDILRVERIR